MLRTKAVYSNEESKRERRHRKLAYKAATEGIVLLENNGALPITEEKVALYGAGAEMTTKGGTGSGEVNERYSVNILDGLKNAGFTVTTMDWIHDFARAYEEGLEAYNKTVTDRK